MTAALACPYCRVTLDETEEQIKFCPNCGTPHHTDCFDENGGCTVFGCIAAPPPEPKLSIGTSELSSVPPVPTLGSVQRPSPAPPPPPRTLYRVKRGFQEFGPYNLADLQQYVQSGNLVPTDEARNEAMSHWMPLSQILGDIPAPVMAGGGQGTNGGTVNVSAVGSVGLPPNLHWAILLVINIFTYYVFNMIWGLIQANWARKLSGKNTSMVLMAIYAGGLVCGVALGSGFGSLLLWCGLICRIAGVFSIRSEMVSYYNAVENIGLSLSGVMTFFFGEVYLQYHINRIARWKKTGNLS